MKVTVDLLDAQMVAILKAASVELSLDWDVTLRDGLVLHVSVQCRPTDKVPDGVIDAVNTCVSEAIKASRAREPD